MCQQQQVQQKKQNKMLTKIAYVKHLVYHFFFMELNLSTKQKNVSFVSKNFLRFLSYFSDSLKKLIRFKNYIFEIKKKLVLRKVILMCYPKNSEKRRKTKAKKQKMKDRRNKYQQ